MLNNKFNFRHSLFISFLPTRSQRLRLCENKERSFDPSFPASGLGTHTVRLRLTKRHHERHTWGEAEQLISERWSTTSGGAAQTVFPAGGWEQGTSEYLFLRSQRDDKTMKTLKPSRILLSFILISGMIYPSIDASQTINTNGNDFTQGLELKNSGKWEQALKTWWAGWNALETAGKTDPRIGIAFIELATEKMAAQYYGTASEMYMQGFSRDECIEFKKTVAKEAERILPLLDKEEEKTWKKLIKSKDPELCQKIRLFWLERDPRPKTKGNERLIEHWERIAYARKHFQMARSSIYDCDDRGTIYVKYGKPDKKKSGSFGTSSESQMELMRFLGIGDESRLIRFRDPNHDYDVWAYGDIGTEKPSIYLFSNRDGTGRFGLCIGIESLIPRVDYIYTIRSPVRRYSPRDYLIYQIMYYSELKSFARFFDERYGEINHIWEGAEREIRRKRYGREKFSLPRDYIQLLHGTMIKNQGEDKLNPISKYADVDRSDYENLTGKINVKTHPVRTLDRQNQPKLALLAFSSPEFRAEDMTIISEDALESPEYFLSHTLIVRDGSLEELVHNTDVLRGSPNNMSAFTLDHMPEHAHFTLASEAYQETALDTLPEPQTKMLAIGKEIVSIQPPLNTDPGTLELSDLVLGIDAPSGVECEDFPFSIIPTHEFTNQDPVKMAIEIYHLVLNEYGEAQYTIEYGVAGVDKKGKRKKEQISMAYSFHALGRSSRETLSVDISKLKPGSYEFFVEVKDTVSRQEKIRIASFSVIK